MAFCTNCGKELSDRAVACPNCGHPTTVPVTAQVSGAHQRTEGNAIAALILAIASFVVCPVVPAIIALILAGKARERMAADPSLEGESLAKAATIISWIHLGLVIAAVVLFFLLAVLGTLSSA